MKKLKQVFLLYETTPSDPYSYDTLLGVHGTLESAKDESMQYPVYPWGRTQQDGSIAAKPAEGFGLGLRIVPTEVKW